MIVLEKRITVNIVKHKFYTFQYRSIIYLYIRSLVKFDPNDIISDFLNKHTSIFNTATTYVSTYDQKHVLSTTI